MTEFHPILPDQLLYRGGELRKNGTVPEQRLWNSIRASRLCGIKFRRQHAVGPFLVDFYCHEHRLVIELDGASHNDQGRYDLEREEYLKAQDLRIIRFSNEQVLFELDAVVRGILVACGRDPDTGALFETPASDQRPKPIR